MEMGDGSMRNVEFNINATDENFHRVPRSPVELFELFFTVEMVTFIVNESNRYANQRNVQLNLTSDEFKCFVGILILSGYVPLPRKAMFWQSKSDVKFTSVSNAMRRNRFDEILKFLHLANNDDLPANDRFAKVRPYINKINERCQKFFKEALMEKNLSIDESMIPYFGRHGAKQFIRGKPIRFGYKVWCMNTPLGYLINFDPYQGKIDNAVARFGVGGNVVIQLAACLPPGPFKLTFDNYFTSLALLDHLAHRGIKATGTICENRTEKCPLKGSSKLKKERRGSFDYQKDVNGHITLVQWHDNSVVTLASNCDCVLPTQNVSRWSKQQKERIQVPQPQMIAEYNKFMGGTDRMDQNISKYRMSIRSKKFYWPLFAFGIEVCIQNAWQLNRATENTQRDLLSFRRYIAQVYLTRYRSLPLLGRPIAAVPNNVRVVDDIRFDNIGHMICPAEGRPRCANCQKRPTTKCIKCNVALCMLCFLPYHTK